MSEISVDTSSSSLNDKKVNDNKKESIKNDFIDIKDNINHNLNSSISITLLNLISENRSKHNYKELLKKQKNNENLWKINFFRISIMHQFVV